MAGTANPNQAGPSNSNRGASTVSPTNPHFFQPILAENPSDLTIPITFYEKHVEGKLTAGKIELITDASAVVWKVKLEGRKITEGFGAFAAAHAYRLGDIIIFRYEGGVRFHVTACGPSCCEIQYSSDTDEDDEMNVEEDDVVSLEDDDEDSAEEDEDSSEEEDEMSVEEEQRVTLAVTESTIQDGRLYIPKEFCESSGLHNHGGGEISFTNDAGGKWQARLMIQISGTRSRLRIAGLRDFLYGNEIKPHDKLVFKLTWEDESTPAL